MAADGHRGSQHFPVDARSLLLGLRRLFLVAGLLVLLVSCSLFFYTAD